MKRLIGLTFAGLAFVGNLMAQEPVVMTVNNEDVTISEFEQIFWKNKKENVTNKEELDEYIELFTNFRLKVEAAEAAGLDTTNKFKAEFNGYKIQLQKPYLVDTSVTDELMKEAYYRTVNELRASHILIGVAQDADPKDTVNAYNKIMKIRDQIINNEISFEDAAKKFSTDPSAKTNGGDLGFFSAFRMVYPFEDAAYKTKMGEISMPFRTRFGYHIVKPTDTRKSRGRVKVAHIMVLTKKSATEQDLANAEQKINEIHEKLNAGEDFATLVMDYSDDRNSVRRNGELDWVEAGKYFQEFEDAAFSLKEDGEYTSPVKTPAGWHIIKRIEYQPIDNYKDLKLELKNKIQRDPVRSAKTKSSFVNKLKKEYAFSKNGKNYDLLLKKLKDSDDLSKAYITSLKNEIGDKELFSYAGNTKTIADFIAYAEPRWNKDKLLKLEDYLSTQFKSFVTNDMTEFEKTRLEDKYPKYKALLKEYRDGILLFEINDQKVWSYAIKDTAGLKEFYEAHKEEYMWKDRVDAQIFTAKDKKVIKKAYKLAKKGELRSDSIVNYLNRDSQLNIAFESGRFEEGKNEYLDAQEFQEGLNKPVLINGKYVLVKIDKKIPAQPKKLSEAKGAITAAYQEYLEDKWITELKAKYEVTVNKDVLYSIKEKP
ncbi:peptidylprolyl isomerase [Parvicella tangerina]|uniref:Chaperone SurA n=1 Tax=Parvicella tangerina TaxID=2829795 RepID=A0A916JMX6_9FLAO|nr:peptidylprolyl isomerase [Parvicella tangerina]CAG5080101.1 Chaperone SurA [Parvicella tangerina]